METRCVRLTRGPAAACCVPCTGIDFSTDLSFAVKVAAWERLIWPHTTANNSTLKARIIMRIK